MKYLKFILIILLLFEIGTVNSQCFDEQNFEYSYCLGELRIEGSTNLNSFIFFWENSLVNQKNVNIKTKICENNNSENLNFNIPLQSFEGGNQAMRNDFLQLVKASEYPLVAVGLEKIEPECEDSAKQIKIIDLSVTLAGVKKTVQADYTSRTDSENRLIISGNTSFLLTDFQLEPPEKAMGLIRVKNEVFIKFDIVIQNSDTNINQALN